MKDLYVDGFRPDGCDGARTEGLHLHDTSVLRAVGPAGSADLHTAVEEHALDAVSLHTGQVRAAGARSLVHETVHGRFADEPAARHRPGRAAAAWIVAPPWLQPPPATTSGAETRRTEAVLGAVHRAARRPDCLRPALLETETPAE